MIRCKNNFFCDLPCLYIVDFKSTIIVFRHLSPKAHTDIPRFFVAELVNFLIYDLHTILQNFHIVSAVFHSNSMRFSYFCKTFSCRCYTSPLTCSVEPIPASTINTNSLPVVFIVIPKNDSHAATIVCFRQSHIHLHITVCTFF